MLKSLRVLLTLALVVSVTAGCYGPFNLTKKLHKWNGEVSQNKWAVEGTFLGLAILPAYFVATIGDAVIFNSIEFWTGNNPIKVATKSIEQGDQQVVLKYDRDNGRLRVDNFIAGRPTGTLVFEKGENGMVARDGQGKVLMNARTEGEYIILSDASGKELSRHNQKEIEAKL